MCPFFRAENRLEDCDHYWNKAAESYQQPRDFAREVQVTIQQLRTVTFQLQSEKRKIPGFDAWYEEQRKKMSDDKVLRWLRDMRNKIEKEGDLEPTSKLRLTFCSDWLSDESVETEFPAVFTAHFAAHGFADLIRSQRKHSEEELIRFDREWRHPDLKDWELLDALTYGYSFLIDLLLDGHKLLDDQSRKSCPFYSEKISSNLRVPGQMTSRACFSSAWYRCCDGTIVSFPVADKLYDAKESLEFAASHSGSTPSQLIAPNSLKDKCHNCMIIGKNILKRDGFVIPVFFIESQTSFLPFAMPPRDRADKHAMVRLAADAVVALRAHTAIFMSECWVSKGEPDAPQSFVHAVDDPNRTEGLSVTAISINGESAGLRCKFARKPSGIEFGEVSSDEDFSGGILDNFMEPIRKAFVRLKNAK